MSQASESRTELAVALDVDTPTEARALVDRIGPAVCWYKIGKQLFTRHGPGVVEQLKEAGKKVFLDLKFHDIPTTVGQAVRSAAAIGADLTNVHASGGAAMLRAAAEAAAESGIEVVAVTVLTSLDDAGLREVGVMRPVAEQVLRLAALTRSCGVGGVVCSPHEIRPLRMAQGRAFRLVVPGIRPAGSAAGDQRRIMTPAQAAAAGADIIVVGRPIRQADNPAAAAEAVLEELRKAAGATAG